MNTKSIVSGLLLILAVGGIVYVLAGDKRPDQHAGQSHDHGAHAVSAAAEAAEQALPADGVVVYYFHGHQRCYTCNKMEALAETTVRKQFADLLRDGQVVFKAVNMQEDANRHFAETYQLTSAAVVMVERKGGADVSWRNLDEVWMKVRNEDEYTAYIAENLTACLREVGVVQG
jgi:hypothetical protein